MFGVKPVQYDRIVDPGGGDPYKHWQGYHQPICQENLRVLRPGGIFAWRQAFKFQEHFQKWFGPHSLWSPILTCTWLYFPPSVWVVQRLGRGGMEPVDRPYDMMIPVDRERLVPWRQAGIHPCPSPIEEAQFMLRHLAKPGDVVLDTFCGLGPVPVAAQQYGCDFIACDLSPNYCLWANRRLRNPNLVPVVPPSVLTCYKGNNDTLLAQVARLYFKPGMRIADVTFGAGRWWRKVDLTEYDFHASDLLTVPEHRYDCRHLPYPSASFHVHCLDIPYIHQMRGGSKYRIHRADYKSAETTKGFTYQDVMELFRAGMTEGHRILVPGGLMLVKCQDMIVHGQQLMAHIDVHNLAVHELGMRVEDFFVLTQPSPLLQFGRSPGHAKKNHSFLWVFRKW
jgi:DNA modification methylase